MTAEDAAEQEVAGYRHALTRQLDELAELAERFAGLVRAWEEPAGWDRILTHKLTAVREAAALLRAVER